MHSPYTPKKRKINQYDNGFNPTTSIPKEFENSSGKIIKVTLINFLNHAHLTFNCSPNLNLIFGRNGQGKSAIVQGIALCLGASGHSVGRDTNLNHYIKDYHLKNGPSCAKIEIYLSNHGLGSYNSELYGDMIIISRTIYKSGSNFYLGGTLVKKSLIDRKLFNNYLRHIKININNPTTYMDQEMCKSFFFQSSSHSFYKYYSACAGLDKMEEKINSEKRNLEDCKAELKVRKRVLEPDQDKLDSLSKQIESFEEKLNEWKSAKESYKLALYKETKEKYKTYKEKYEKHKDNNPSEQIKKLEDKINEYNNQITELKNDIQKLIADSFEQKDKIRNTSDNISTCEDAIKDFKSTMVALDKNMLQVEKDLKKFGTEDKPTENNTNDAVNDIKKELERINNEYDKLEEENQNLISELTLNENTKNEIEFQMKQVNSDMDELKRDIDNMTSNDNKSIQKSRVFLYKYDPNRIKECIKKMKSQNLFVHEPIGPVGEYLKVIPNVPSWKVLPIIERHLKKFLFTWLVSTEQDRITLEKLLVDNGCDYHSVKITKTNLFNCKTDILSRTEKELKNNSYKSLIFNFLAIKEIPIVLINILIDSFNISKTAICKDEKEMVKVLNDENLRITAAYTLNNLDFGKRLNNGSLFLTPSYDKNPYHYRFIRYSDIGNHNINIELKQRLNECRLRENNLKKYSKELSIKLFNNNKLINSIKSKLNTIKNKKTQLIACRTKLESDLNNQIEVDQILYNTDSVDEVIKLKAKYTEQLNDLKIQMKNHEDKLEEVLKEMKVHESKLKDLRSDLDKILANISEKKMESNKTQTLINQNKTEIKKLLRETVTYTSTLNDYKKEMDEIFKQVNKIESELNELGLDYNGQLPNKSSQEYLKIVNANREILTSIVDSSKGVENHLESLKTRYTEAKESFKDKQSKLEETQNNYNRQKSNYSSRLKLFDEYRLRMEKLAKAVFKSTLDSVCGYDGSLIFNDINRTLDVHIHNKQQSYEKVHVARDLKTLSGGEQSSIQLSMIHSLASLSFSPLHMFDEIDVYMDESTRIKNVNAIVDFASNNRDRQFFLLTPHMEFAKHVSDSYPDITKLFNVSKTSP